MNLWPNDTKHASAHAVPSKIDHLLLQLVGRMLILPTIHPQGQGLSTLTTMYSLILSRMDNSAKSFSGCTSRIWLPVDHESVLWVQLSKRMPMLPAKHSWATTGPGQVSEPHGTVHNL